MKFAIIETGGKQYKVKEGDVLRIEKIEADEKTPITFDKVLLVSENERVSIGNPHINGALVAAKVLRAIRDKKKIIFRFHNKTRYRKKKGHKQPLTEVLIEKIN